MTKTYTTISSTLRSLIAGFTVMTVVAGFLLQGVPAKAASYTSSVVSGGGSLTMQPGEVKDVSVQFLNTSDFTWKNDGPGYVSLYTYEPKYRSSDFDPGTWVWGDRPARLREASVAPGQKGSVDFQLKAPAAEGSYTETFRLASEEQAWFEGGTVSFKITVAKDSSSASTQQPTDASAGLSGEVAVTSAASIAAKAGRSITFTAGFKNTGSKTWSTYSLKQSDVQLASDAGSFAHPSWNGATLASANASISPGQMAVVTFALTAPNVNGEHTARFQLYADDAAIPGAELEIPVTVTGGSSEAINAPKITNDSEVDTGEAVSYVEEPIVRIAFLIVDEETDDEVVITSDASDFTLQTLGGSTIAELKASQTVRAYYLNGTYYYDLGNGPVASSEALRFVPTTENAVMRVANFDRRETRNARYADNEFRGILELRHNDYKDRTWVINELPVEYYLRGLAETSNVSPIEYQKALITSARTYVYYHFTHATKYAKEYFHISSYSWDQVYNGYGQEVRAPKITQAAEETRGRVVTYDGDLAITPYFSRSDGRTRDWSEVWGGSVPWAKSVPVPCDAGKTLWGHGVGLSASGALCMANDGMLWDEILKYFFTGIELNKAWE